MIVRGRAPLRLSFCGGGTDLPPYVNEHGGIVLNATIDRYAYATIQFPVERVLRVRSLDLDTVIERPLEEAFEFDGKHDLILACIRRFVPDLDSLNGGLEFYLETDAPKGSGLGGSSAVVAAIIGALRKWQHLLMDNYQMAHLAWEIERRDVGVPGGMQDQYATVFGGVNLIEFNQDGSVVVNPLRIDLQLINELQYNTLLVYTGIERGQSHVIESQIAGYKEKRTGIKSAMDAMKELTVQAKNSLLTGRLTRLGEILHEEWLMKKQTADTISTPQIDEMYDEARRLGVVGGKISGAGGGGFMFFYCPFDRKPAVLKRLVDLGATEFGFAFEPSGMQSWIWEELR